jgi:hypothetical protein
MENEISLEGIELKFLDWNPSLDVISQKKSKIVLELGCGVGTQFLCRDFKEVYSFEASSTNEWFLKTQSLLGKWDNWKGVFYTHSELGVSEAISNLMATNSNRNKEVLDIENGVYDRIHQFVDLNKIDVVFIDHSMKMRGETINYFMNKEIPIIFAHDTNYGNTVYGWDLVQKRDDYGIIVERRGQGTTYWIKK